MNLSAWDHDCRRLDIKQEPAPAVNTKVTLQLEPPYKSLVVEVRGSYFLNPKVTYDGKRTGLLFGNDMGGILGCKRTGAPPQHCSSDFKC